MDGAGTPGLLFSLRLFQNVSRVLEQPHMAIFYRLSPSPPFPLLNRPNWYIKIVFIPVYYVFWNGGAVVQEINGLRMRRNPRQA
jgi:hypothetical protein